MAGNQDIVLRLRAAGDAFSADVNRILSGLPAQAEASGAQAGEKAGAAMAAKMNQQMAGRIAGGITLVAGAVGVAIQQVISNARELSGTSRALGLSVESLQRWRNAAQAAGVTATAIDKPISALSEKILAAASGNKEAAAAFTQLGVSFRTATGGARDTETVLTDVAAALREMHDPSRELVAGTALMGDGYRDLSPILSQARGGMLSVAGAQEEINRVITAKEIAQIEQAARAWDQMKASLLVDVSSAMARNTDEISSLIGTLGRLTSSAIDAASAYARFVRATGGTALALTPIGAGAAIAGVANTGNRGPRFTDRYGGFTPTAASRRAAALQNARSIYSPIAGPTTPAAANDAAMDARAGSSRSRRGGGSGRSRGESDAQREAERLSKERASNEERLNEFIRDGLAAQSDAARIESIRVEKGERAADLARVEADFLRQHPEAAAATVAEFARLAELAPPITEADRARLQALMDQLKVVRDQTVELERQRGITEDDAAKRAATADRQKAEFEETQAKLRDLREEEKRRAEDQLATLADYYEGLFSGRSGDIWKDFKAQGIRVLAELAAQWTLGQLSGGGGIGVPPSSRGGLLGTIGSLFNSQGGAGGLSSLFGGGQGGAASAAAGAGPIGLAIAGNLLVNKLLGNDQRVGGPLLHLALGPIASMALAMKKGSASLNFADGQLGVGATAGNSKSRIAAAKSAVGSLAGTLSDIADALDGEITGAGSVSIGKRGKKFTVDTTGANRTKGAGVLKFKSEEEAIRAALEDALKDGVIGAISEASRRILASGQDLQKSIEKAALIESIPKALKARLDPVGAALDAVNDKWEKVIAALNEGGASAEQMADAQKLYRMELDDARTSAQAASATLKDFLQSLGVGAASPLSLRAQESGAAAALRPFLESIDAGRTIDQQAYQAAAQQFLDIERQINASGPAFFAEFDKIRDYTSRAISTIDNATTLAPARDLFAEKTASSTQATAEILAEQTGQLTAIKNYLAQIAAGGGAAGGFIGAGRGFA